MTGRPTRTARRCGATLAGALLAPLALGAAPEDPQGLWCFEPERRAPQRAYEAALREGVSNDRLAETHAVLSARPHPAGSPGDLDVIRYLAESFRSAGLEVEEQWLDLYLATPVDAEVELVTAGARVALPLRERPVEGDPDSASPEVSIGWNAYSASGDVTAEYVYVNYGRQADFERLAELGVDLTGKIALARYGGNFRGFKAKFAEAAGAAGLIMFTDPEDSGYVRGLMYPDGGYANGSQIQRGSIKTLPYAGDPLTPGFPATPGARRLDPETVALPRIPVQPIGWDAAEPLLRAMTGPVVPEPWQGALPLNYRLESGAGVRVRLRVEQERGLVRTANVVGTIRGAVRPDEVIVVGGHHDAWTHGAGDPNAGLMIVVELARVFAERAAAGEPPDRTIMFAGWAAEEYGLIGSTEWVERHADMLRESCVAYLNLDMSAMGPHFWASAAPTLKGLVIDATRDVAQACDPGTTVYDAWLTRTGADASEPAIGNLGGGSDHVAFYCHVGVPSMTMGGRGGRGVSYHSAYDTIHWYRKVVGDDYEPGAMVARVGATAVARLANADVLPLDASRYASDMRRHLDDIEARAARVGMELPLGGVHSRVAQLLLLGREYEGVRALFETGAEAPSPERVESINGLLMSLERVWVGQGLPGRPWYRSTWVSPDANSGYAAWMLPKLRAAIEMGDDSLMHEALTTYERTLDVLVDRARELGYDPAGDAGGRGGRE